MVGITLPLVMGRWHRRARCGHATRTCHVTALATSHYADQSHEASPVPESTNQSLLRMSTGFVRVDTERQSHIGIDGPTWHVCNLAMTMSSQFTLKSHDRTQLLRLRTLPKFNGGGEPHCIAGVPREMAVRSTSVGRANNCH